MLREGKGEGEGRRYGLAACTSDLGAEVLKIAGELSDADILLGFLIVVTELELLTRHTGWRD